MIVGLPALMLGLATLAVLVAARANGLLSASAPPTPWLQVLATIARNLQAIGQLFAVAALRTESTGLLALLAYVILAGLALRLYLVNIQPPSLEQPRYQWLLFLLVLLTIGTALAMVPGHAYLAYLVPVAALSATLALLIDVPLSVLVTILIALLMGYMAGGSLGLTAYAAMGGLVGALSLERRPQVSRLPWIGGYVALSNVTVVLISAVSGHNLDPLELAQLLAIGVANGVLSASLALIGLFLINNLLGITSSLQLLDLSQPTQPLLRQLLLRAPGTYHHSLMVSNLAEQAAECIGADPLLTRVGAYYHDVGKMMQPEFFAENQQPGTNGHDRLDPWISAEIIVGHVEEGLDLAQKYRLPREVRAFIAEHHGTTLVRSFYDQALRQSGDPTGVDEADFRYPGPKPGSKETAIVMLADCCEAAVRAERPATAEQVDQLVRCIIMDKVSTGQFDACDLTLHDLDQIRDTFCETLLSAFHARIKYPEQHKTETGGAVPSPIPLNSQPTPAAYLLFYDHPQN
jgi:putative nucleotidyltransferase with HDIG domain